MGRWWCWPTIESEVERVNKRRQSRAKAAGRKRLTEARDRREAEDRAARLRLEATAKTDR